MATLAHLSDLHLGGPRTHADRARQLVSTLVEAQVEHVVVTGDLTQSGRSEEYALFLEIFDPLLRRGKVTVVPGNHDRGNDDAGRHMHPGCRVWTRTLQGLHLVCVDSTAPHNKTSFRSHGELSRDTLDEVDAALADAAAGSLVAVLLHHHVVRLPEETLGEWFAVRFGWPHANELELGDALLRRCLGRADLVLHGHRHVPRSFRVAGPEARPLRIFNAGSSTELSSARLFTHQHGALVGEPVWSHDHLGLVNAEPAPVWSLAA
jgi:3',5'-cyclic AMP phosphodiesterase CpdA